jgi:hypothetical protein
MKKVIPNYTVLFFGMIIFGVSIVDYSIAHGDPLINLGPNGKFISALAAEPSDNRTLYVGTQSGLFKSTNGGRSWVPINEGMTNREVARVRVPSGASTGASTGLL